MLVSVLRQGDFLIASIHTALDVLDSFGSRCLRNLAHMARLRGAETVLVGIQPDVAFAMVQLGTDLEMRTALDLEEGLEVLEELTSGGRVGRSSMGVLSDGR